MSGPEPESAVSDTSKQYIWSLGMDGSKLSWMAWDFAAHLIAPRGEQLKVVHVTAPTQKQSLVPAQLRPEKLQADVEHRNYEHRLNVEWVEATRESGTKVGTVLCTTLHQMQPRVPNFLVIGSFGRKEKDNHVYLGHVPDALLKNSMMDVLIVKSNRSLLPTKDKPTIWVVGTDNSDCAAHALRVTLELMRPEDKLCVYYAAKYESFAKRVEAKQKSIAAAAGRECEFVFQHVQGQANYGDVLCRFAERQSANVLVIGHGGHSRASAQRQQAAAADADDGGGKKLGSVSEHCAEQAGCALLIVKGQISDASVTDKQAPSGGGERVIAQSTPSSLAVSRDY